MCLQKWSSSSCVDQEACWDLGSAIDGVVKKGCLICSHAALGIGTGEVSKDCFADGARFLYFFTNGVARDAILWISPSRILGKVISFHCEWIPLAIL